MESKRYYCFMHTAFFKLLLKSFHSNYCLIIGFFGLIFIDFCCVSFQSISRHYGVSGAKCMLVSLGSAQIQESRIEMAPMPSWLVGVFAWGGAIVPSSIIMNKSTSSDARPITFFKPLQTKSPTNPSDTCASLTKPKPLLATLKVTNAAVRKNLSLLLTPIKIMSSAIC